MYYKLRFISQFIAFIFVALVFGTASASELDVRKVWIDDVAGLSDYLKKNYGGANLNRKTLDIHLVDLDESPDGVDEVLLGVNDFAFTCGNRGCNYEVLKRLPSGELSSVFAMITFDLVPASGYTKGYRNLASSKFDDAIVLKFDGSTYKVSSQTVADLKAQKPPSPVQAPQKWPVNFKGKCGKRGTWFGFGDPHGSNTHSAGGKASFGNCGDGEHWFAFACQPGASTIELSIEGGLAGASDGKPISHKVRVGRKSFSLNGVGRFSEMLGGVQPVLTFERDNGMLDALMSGNRFRFRIDGRNTSVHLNGSRKAIEAMLLGCPVQISQAPSVQPILADNKAGDTAEIASGGEPVNRCDALASSPHDSLAVSKAVDYATLRSHAKQAVDACRAAVKANIDGNRMHYQLGRSLLAMNKNKEAASAFLMAAEAEYPAAMNAYGVLLNHGRGVPQNSEEALRFIKAAAEKNNVPAMANLGALLNNIAGSGVSGVVDRKASMKWLNAAANAGDALAMARLGWNHGMGDGGARQDKDLAFQWIERALKLNEESAHYIAIEISGSGFGDMKRAAQYKRRVAGTKNRMALAHIDKFRYSAKFINKLEEIGFRFDRPEEEPTHVRGFLFDQDESHAAYIDALMKNLPASARKAGEKFITDVEQKRKEREVKTQAAVNVTPPTTFNDKGAETECDILTSSQHDSFSRSPSVAYMTLRAHSDNAVEACLKAVADFPESERAKYQLGRALLASEKHEKAAKWMRVAAAAGYPAAMNAYGVLLDHGRGVEVDEKASFDWLRRAAEAGNAVAAINVATAYFMGHGTTLNAELATQWTEIGAAANDPMAMFTLGAGKLQIGLWYRTPKVRRNETEGLRLLVKAHEAGEREATYTLHQLVVHEGVGNFAAEPDVKRRLLSADDYRELLNASGNRRVIMDRMLKKDSSAQGIISAIDDILALPHPVDRSDHEPVYVVDVYMDNEYVLGQHVSGISLGKIGVHKELTDAYHKLVNSPRSFERFRGPQQ